MTTKRSQMILERQRRVMLRWCRRYGLSRHEFLRRHGADALLRAARRPALAA
ncbi:MAG: hypothetical protein ACE5JR_02925 [Gemmatimonadota bacterium]